MIAKTGTAEFDKNGAILTHAWMIAAQGDLAVAVFVDEGTSGSGTAGPILEQFLRAACRWLRKFAVPSRSPVRRSRPLPGLVTRR